MNKPTVRATIVIASSVEQERCEWVLRDAFAKCHFTGGAVWFTDLVDRSAYARIFPIRIDNREHYQRFMLHQLPVFADMIPTNHVLIMQPDTMVANPAAWTDEFLGYDYIGAPWPDNRCGNGGFCLRSQRFLGAQMELGWEIFKLRRDWRSSGASYNDVNEDVVLCYHLHDRFTGLGMKYADANVGNRFSTETWPDRIKSEGYTYKGSFGAHGWETLKRIPGVERNHPSLILEPEPV